MSTPCAKIVIRAKPDESSRYDEGEVLINLKAKLGTACLDHLHYVNSERCWNSRARTIETIRCRAGGWAACLGLEVEERL